LRLVHAEALRALGREDRANAAIRAARARILGRAQLIEDAAMRRSFVDAIEVHRRTLALAADWGVGPAPASRPPPAGGAVHGAQDGGALLLAAELLDLDLVLPGRGGGERDRGGALGQAGGELADDPVDDHRAGGRLDLEREGRIGVFRMEVELDL